MTVIFAIALAGCGGGTDEDSSATTSPVGSTPAYPKPSDAPYAELLAADNTGFSDSDNYTRRRTLRYSVTLPVDGAGLEYSTNFGGTWINWSRNIPLQRDTVTVSFSTDGDKNVQFRATNGPAGESKGPVFSASTITIDTIAPTTPVFEVPSGGTLTTTDKRFRWQWAKVYGGANETYFDVYLDGVAVKLGTKDNYYAPTTDLAVGNHVLRVQAYDLSGNPAPATVSSTVTIQ
ncbi:hypothetical protein [Parvibium lacunae]|uniref:Bacterial Ig-like domain-containing protein n=1 Tax=Parvibium lacunae TaxID=1888893 RepID=A0A368L356_9BURK|nr:hypothetical protein [Parvibium lacunae]RCS58026.1 hypothetical protein DU000_04065 [Parvibium lacunae]